MIKIAGFEFAAGARFQPGDHADAGVVGKHIEMLRKKAKGELTPQAVLDDARHNNSPLHTFFEWDDSAAAEQHRLRQARGLIRAVVAVYKETGKDPVRARAYVHIPEPSSPHYREATQALSQAGTRKLVLDRALRELRSWRDRYRDLEELADICGHIDRIESE